MTIQSSISKKTNFLIRREKQITRSQILQQSSIAAWGQPKPTTIEIRIPQSQSMEKFKTTNKTWQKNIHSHDLPISCISHERQPWDLAKEASCWPIHQRDKQKEKHSAIEALHDPHPHPILRHKGPIEQIGEDQKHVKCNGLHGVEPDVAAEGRGVANYSKVESEEDEDGGDRGGAKEVEEWQNGAKGGLDDGELGEHEAAVLEPIEERVQVARGREDAVGRLDGRGGVFVVWVWDE